MNYLYYFLIIFLLIACKKKETAFPLDQQTMIENKMYGSLLEYAPYDTTKIGLVDSILCDTLRKNSNLVFSKTKSRIKDSLFYHFKMHEQLIVKNDYIGMIYVDIHRFDSLHLYNFNNDFRYGTNEFMKIIQTISTHNKVTEKQTLKFRKVKNSFVPNFYFVVMVDKFLYTNGFTKKYCKLKAKIDTMLNSCAKKIITNETIKIEPFIKITSAFTDIYHLKHKYQTPLDSIYSDEVELEFD